MSLLFSFFFHDTATTEIYTLSLHDALPILSCRLPSRVDRQRDQGRGGLLRCMRPREERRSEEHTSDSSHPSISYAVFCLKKKKNTKVADIYIRYLIRMCITRSIRHFICLRT